MKKILIIGNSHTGALKRAKPAEDEQFVIYNLIEQGIDNITQLNPQDYFAVVFHVGGNQHNIFGLINYPEPFDFYLPANPNLVINAQARILPTELVQHSLRRTLNSVFKTVDQLLAYFKNNTIYQLESPPPVSSDQHIINNPGVFKARIEQYGISPAALRYKLWRLHSELVAEYCSQHHIGYISVPQTAQSADGFLLEEYWNTDPTHGNAAYGALVLEQLRTLI